jgi:hypothetical protein
MSRRPTLTPDLVVSKNPPGAAAVPQVRPPQKAKGPPAPEGLEGLNFKVPASFRREFRVFAAQRDMSLVELLQASFETYRKSQK